METPEPWMVEAAVIQTVNLPLNLDQNRHSPSYELIRARRRQAKQVARCLPVHATLG
jgi:hypothetical protein